MITTKTKSGALFWQKPIVAAAVCPDGVSVSGPKTNEYELRFEIHSSLGYFSFLRGVGPEMSERWNMAVAQKIGDPTRSRLTAGLDQNALFSRRQGGNIHSPFNVGWATFQSYTSLSWLNVFEKLYFELFQMANLASWIDVIFFHSASQ